MPYLTPDTAPDDTICRVLRIPYDPMWIAIVDGAVSELVRKFNFEQFGTATPEETASRFLDMYAEYIYTDCGDDMSGCCYDVVLHRVTSTGSLEISINGGDWHADPQDPRLTATQYPPIVFDAHHTKCDAATNVNEHINDVIAGVSEQLGGTGSLIEIAIAIAALLIAFFVAPESIPLIAPVILPLIAGLLFLGQAAWDAYFTTEVHDQILCCVYCNIAEDGTFTQEQYDATLACITAALPSGVARDMLVDLLSRVGLIGFNDYAAIGSSADADCADCDCNPCDLDDWTTYFGTEDDRTIDTISLTGLVDGSRMDAGITTGSNDLCCHFAGLNVTSGSPGFIHYYWVECGHDVNGAWDGNDSAFAPDISLALNRLLISANGAWSGIVTLQA